MLSKVHHVPDSTFLYLKRPYFGPIMPFIPKNGLAGCGRLLFWNIKEACLEQVSRDDVPAVEVCAMIGGRHYLHSDSKKRLSFSALLLPPDVKRSAQIAIDYLN